MRTTQMHFSAEFKREVFKQTKPSGNSIAQVAKDLQLDLGTLRCWVKQFGSGIREATPGKDLKPAQTQELERLRRELRQVKIDRRQGERGRNWGQPDADLPALAPYLCFIPTEPAGRRSAPEYRVPVLRHGKQPVCKLGLTVE
jgi:transposase-like protein